MPQTHLWFWSHFGSQISARRSICDVASLPGQVFLARSSRFRRSTDVGRRLGIRTRVSVAICACPAGMVSRISLRSGPGHRGCGYSRNSFVNSPMPSIATVTVLTGSFITPTPTEVPTAMRSPGSRVMSWEILLTSSCAVKIMSDIG